MRVSRFLTKDANNASVSFTTSMSMYKACSSIDENRGFMSTEYSVKWSPRACGVAIGGTVYQLLVSTWTVGYPAMPRSVKDERQCFGRPSMESWSLIVICRWDIEGRKKQYINLEQGQFSIPLGIVSRIRFSGRQLLVFGSWLLALGWVRCAFPED